MTETSKFVQSLERVGAYDAWAQFRNLLSHSVQQVAMPSIASRCDLIHVSSHQFKKAFQAGIKSVQIQGHRIQISSRFGSLLRRAPRGLSTSDDLFQIV